MKRIFLLGFMASGKTTLGKALAREIGFTFIDMDQEIAMEQQKSIADIFSQNGEDYFRELESRFLNRIINQEDIVVATGGGTPCFNNNIDIINNAGVSIYLKQPVTVLSYRLKTEKEKRPLVSDLNKSSLAGFVTNMLKDRKPFYEQARIIIKPNFSSVNSTVEKINQIFTKQGFL
jgi:shikimate kinase